MSVKDGTARSGTGGRSAATDASRALGLNAGWTVLSYLIAGMAAYGAIGWLIGRAVHVAVLFPVGLLVGLAISLGYIIYRFGSQGGLGDGQSPQERGGHRGVVPPGKKGR